MSRKFLSTVAIACLLSGYSYAADLTTEELQKSLAETFSDIYETVTVEDFGSGWKVKLPENEVITFATDELGLPKFDEKGEPVEISEKISASEMDVIKIEDFNGKSRYKLSSNSPSRLQNIAHNLFSFHNFVPTKYSEELHFVPEIKEIVAQHIKAENVIYAEKDSSTGLKSEIANLKSLNFNSTMVPSDGKMTYSVDWNADGLNFKHMMFSLSIKSIVNKMVAVYEDNGQKEYSKLIMDAGAGLDSSSVMNVNGFSVEAMGTPITMDMKVITKTEKDIANDSLKISAGTDLYNISSPLLSEFKLNRLVIKYLFKDIPVDAVKQISSVQEKMMEEALANKDNADMTKIDDKYQKELMLVVDDVLAKMEFKMQVNGVFEDANLNFVAATKKAGDYVVGNAKITVENLDKIVPDYSKICEEEQKASPDSFPASCLKAGFTEGIRSKIDLSKRTTNNKGQTIDTVSIVLNETGIYVDGKKVSEPIKFNIQELLAQQEAMANVDMSADEAELGFDVE
ncbi:MAG: hypothetical protein IJZ59_02550 [Alphaproteobacteria bacterium]|nr:hypothetical protein [Alphaproteobacteria bacterium]